MIITTRAYVYNGSEPLESSAIFGIVGGAIACLLFVSVFAIIVKKRRQKDREQASAYLSTFLLVVGVLTVVITLQD
jgi:O-antigen ligase